MKFAILGDDDQTLLLAKGIAHAQNHQLVWAGDITDQTRLQEIAPDLTPSDDWEILLESDRVDAVIIAASRASDEFRREDQLRKFTQSQTPLVISHPVNPSMLLHYELDMIRQESDCRMIPLIVDLYHRGFADLCQLYQQQDDEAEVWQQIVFSRWMKDRTKESVAAQFARDVALIRHLVGDITELSAMGTYQGETAEDRQQAYSNLGIQLTGPAGILIRWSVEPAVDFIGGSLNLLSTTRKATLKMPTDSSHWSLETKAAEVTETLTYEDYDAQQESINQIEASLSQNDSKPTWIDAARAVEISESIDTSLRRNRTVKFYNETYSEEGSFKGLMSMLSCGLLLLTLFFFGILAVVEFFAKELGFANVVNVLDKWPYLLFFVLFVFLLLQFLRLAARKAPND